MDEYLTWKRIDDVIVFSFHGSIVSEVTGELRHKIIQVLSDERSDNAVFHMEDASYIDSMGIGMFVNLHVHHHERIKFQFCCLSEGISRAFGYVKLISFFNIADTLEDALEESDIGDL